MIALYERVSSREQAMNGHSIDEQRERLENYCKAMGWDNICHYTDAGISGAKLDRPALNRLIEDVKNKKVNKVLVYKLDRLSRSQKDTLWLIEDVFLSQGCDFASISENFDTSTPLGRAMIGILAVFAQLEREQIKERMYMGKEARAKMGKYSGSSNMPIGYDYIDGNLVPNEDAVLVQRIFREYSDGKTLNAIVSDLNKEGLYHKKGKWYHPSASRTLQNRHYIGEILFSGKWYAGVHPPIVDRELFDRVQTIYAKKLSDFKELNRRVGKATSYLGGYMYCAKCGEKYVKFASHQQRYVYYACKNHKLRKCRNKFWKMQELDEIVFSEIKKLRTENDDIVSETPSKRPVIESKMKELDNQMSRLMDLYTLGSIPIDMLQTKVENINEQRERLKNTLSIPEKMSKQEAFSLASSFSEIIETGDFDEIHSLIGALIERIEINEEDVTIKWAFS